jgi:phosphoglycerate kinase
MKKTIKDTDVADKRILVRVDLDVPLESTTPADEARVRSAIPTIQYLLERRARVILCGHMGQPTEASADEPSLDPLRDRLAELLQVQVGKVDDCIGPDVRRAVDNLQPGEVLLLGDTEFYAGEKKNNPIFASELASIADLYVNDDFVTAYRSMASTEGAARHLPAVAGLSFSRQLEGLERLQAEPERPFVAILGGPNFADKIGVIEHLLERADCLLVGGDVARAFLSAAGLEAGSSRSVEQHRGTATRLKEKAGEKLVTPVDVVVGGDLAEDSGGRAVSVGELPPESYIRDIGPRSIELFQQKLANARTVVWYGALSAPELPPTSHSNLQIAKVLGELEAQSIVGGGDAIAAAERAGVAEQFTLVSTGEETFLALLSGRDLPGVSVLEDKNGSAPSPEPAQA